MTSVNPKYKGYHDAPLTGFIVAMELEVCVHAIGDEQICGVFREHHDAYMGDDHQFINAQLLRAHLYVNGGTE